jgi:hypothetical protein
MLEGWSCPHCGRAHAPDVKTCPEPGKAVGPPPVIPTITFPYRWPPLTSDPMQPPYVVTCGPNSWG